MGFCQIYFTDKLKIASFYSAIGIAKPESGAVGPAQDSAMSEIVVKIIKGRQIWDIPCLASTTFDQLRRLVEDRAEAVEGGLRLIHKGRAPGGNQSLSSVGVITGTKIMALITPMQREADVRAEKKARLRHETGTLNELRERTNSAANSSVAEASDRPAVQGDIEVPGLTHVLLKKGRESFRVNVALSASVGELKMKVSTMNGIDAQMRDIKLLHGGRFLKDDRGVLENVGVKDGDVLMVMFGMQYHDAADARTEMGSIERETGELEALLKEVLAKRRGRLLDEAELAVEKSRVVGMLERLRDNAASVRGEDQRRRVIEGRLQKVEDDAKLLD